MYSLGGGPPRCAPRKRRVANRIIMTITIVITIIVTIIIIAILIIIIIIISILIISDVITPVAALARDRPVGIGGSDPPWPPPVSEGRELVVLHMVITHHYCYCYY